MRKLKLYVVILALVPALFMTSCKKDLPIVEAVDYYAVMTNYMSSNGLDLTDLLSSWIITASSVVDVAADFSVPDYHVFDVRANSEGDGYYSIDGDRYYAGEAPTGATDVAGEYVGNLEGTIEHRNKLAPYLTVGFRPNITNNFGLFGELGAAYMGKTDAKINRTDDNPNSAANIVADRAEQDLEDKDWLEWMPIVKLGATYRF